jgi:hypothetical protein
MMKERKTFSHFKLWQTSVNVYYDVIQTSAKFLYLIDFDVHILQLQIYWRSLAQSQLVFFPYSFVYFHDIK